MRPWTTYLDRPVVEHLNVEYFTQFEPDGDLNVRMCWNKAPFVKHEITVARNLVDRTWSYICIAGTQLCGKDRKEGTLLFEPLDGCKHIRVKY